MLVSQKRLLRNKHNIPEMPTMVQGPESRAPCPLASEPLLIEPTLCIMCEQYRTKSRKAQALAKDRREDGGVEKASMAISLGNGHKESRPKEIRLCLMQGKQRRDSDRGIPRKASLSVIHRRERSRLVTGRDAFLTYPCSAQAHHSNSEPPCAEKPW